MIGTDWDVIVLGTGSGGKIAAQQLAEAGRRVLAVESGRFGGECPYVACVPAKSILAAAHAGLGWTEAVRRRDDVTDGRVDAAGRTSLDKAGVITVRGRGRLAAGAPGLRVQIVTDDDPSRPPVVGRPAQTADAVIIATGSTPTVPPVEGLAQVDHWTSDQALSATDQPASLVILGGGAVGCELAQAFALLGTQVHLIEIADQLLPGEPGWVGEVMADQLRADGVQVSLGAEPERVEHVDDHDRVRLADGRTIVADRVLVAGGRRPNTGELGLSDLEVAIADSGAVPIDDHCRVLGSDGHPVPGLYAVGDVTEESSYTHSANYQAKVAAAGLLGRGRPIDYRAIPRVVYTRPTAYGVGLTPEQARDRGLTVQTPYVPIAEAERATLLEHNSSPPVTVRGGLQLIIADGVLVGAAAVGPEADSWSGELALAIRARVPVDVLGDHVRAFPTWSEAITAALDSAQSHRQEE